MSSPRIVPFFFLRHVQENLPLVSVAGKWKVKFLMKIRFFMKNVMKVILCGFYCSLMCFYFRSLL